jgi:NADP-dependent 3-hydroxy acid dehydrogenase YdfG
VITGGTTGIGRAVACSLAMEGANVFIAGNNNEHLNDALQHIEQLQAPGKVKGIAVDLSTEEGINEMFSRADEHLGKLDVLINNAALAHQDVYDGEYKDWERVIKTNLLSYVACTRYALDRMTPTGRGHIINMGSMSSDVREKGSSIYVATKAGIQGFTETLRKEVNEKGIKITLVEPGAVGSNMQPYNVEEQKQSRERMEMMKAEDIAEAVLYTLNRPMRCDVVEIKIKPHLQII